MSSLSNETATGWIPLADVNFSDETINQYHVDTRDFHVNCFSAELKEKIDWATLKKYGNNFFFTPDEIVEMLNRFFAQSGGNVGWRFFMLKGLDNWQLKYIRIIRTADGLTVCNNNFYALNRDTLQLPVNTDKDILNAH